MCHLLFVTCSSLDHVGLRNNVYVNKEYTAELVT
jgi:hypothetical protein